MLFTLITSQLAIAGQLGREIYPWNIGLFLEKWETEMTWKKGSWWMRLLEIDLPYSEEP